MGINTLTTIGTITQTEITGDLFDQYYTAMSGDFIPRTAGVPTNLGSDLGTSSYKWNEIHANNFTLINSGALTARTITSSSNVSAGAGGVAMLSQYNTTMAQSTYLEFSLANDQMGEFNINSSRTGAPAFGTFGKWMVYNPNGTFSVNTISTQDSTSGGVAFDIYQPSVGLVRIINTGAVNVNIRAGYWVNGAT